MDPYEGFDVDLIGEAPCEFCSEMWPLSLLTEHQSIHLADPNYMEEFLDGNEAQNVIAEEISLMRFEPQVAAEQLQQSSAPTETASVKPGVQLQESIAKNVEQLQQSSTSIKAENNEGRSPPLKKNKMPDSNDVKKLKTEKIREFTTESGVKTVIYGTDIEQEKDFEDAKRYVPSNPLINSSVCKEEDIEDINNLSDDDCSESLEEFWKRARDHIRRNKARC